LITLAAANSLDYLLYPALPVIIPNAVFFEVTNAAGKLGAEEILDWYRAHMDAVRVEPTEAFAIPTSRRSTSHFSKTPRGIAPAKTSRKGWTLLKNLPNTEAASLPSTSFSAASVVFATD
jgi:hypothetical protein